VVAPLRCLLQPALMQKANEQLCRPQRANKHGLSAGHDVFLIIGRLRRVCVICCSIDFSLWGWHSQGTMLAPLRHAIACIGIASLPHWLTNGGGIVIRCLSPTVSRQYAAAVNNPRSLRRTDFGHVLPIQVQCGTCPPLPWLPSRLQGCGFSASVGAQDPITAPHSCCHRLVLDQNICDGPRARTLPALSDTLLASLVLHCQFHSITKTRWSDNDQYAHVNNTKYYEYADTCINDFLIRKAGLVTEPTRATTIGLVVNSSMCFHAPLSYPEVISAAFGISHIGTSSVTYRCELQWKTPRIHSICICDCKLPPPPPPPPSWGGKTPAPREVLWGLV